MGRPVFSPELSALKRRQLDERLSLTSTPPGPDEGWIRAIRQALGMTAAQLGRRMGISATSVTDMEQREKAGRVTVGRLEQAAKALNCELRVGFIPNDSLEETVRAQADRKATATSDEIIHTMRLEAQSEGVDKALALSRARDRWLTSDLSRLWD